MQIGIYVYKSISHKIQIERAFDCCLLIVIDLQLNNFPWI